jgi:hypothetical protein
VLAMVETIIQKKETDDLLSRLNNEIKVKNKKQERDVISEAFDVLNHNSYESFTKRGYEGLAESVKRLIQLQIEMDSQLRMEGSPLLNIFYTLKGKTTELITGKKRKHRTLDQLFDAQLKTITEMNQYLRSIISNSDRVRHELMDYGNSIEHALQDSTEDYKSLATNLERKASLVLETSETLKETNKGNNNYYTYNKHFKALGRELREIDHQKIKLKQNIIFYTQEEELIDKYECMVEYATYFCDEFNNNVENIVRHVKNTKQMYSHIKNMGGSLEELGKAADKTTEYVMHAVDGVGKVLTHMSKIVSDPKNQGHLPGMLSNSLDDYIIDIVNAQESRSQDIEVFSKQILNGSSIN